MEILRSEDPIVLFQNWLTDARKSEPNDAEAMALATTSPEGFPSVRMVLLKSVDQQGFRFYTNMESRKGRELKVNPYAALCFHWKSLLRQVRVEGRAEPVTEQEADAYFQSRHPLSRLGAWASRQSQILSSRGELIDRAAAYKEKFGTENIPRPPHWSGYLIVPTSIEFWQQGDSRLHDRFIFTRTAAGWDLARLNP